MRYFTTSGSTIKLIVRYIITGLLIVQLAIMVLTELRSRSRYASSELVRTERQANREQCFRHIQTTLMNTFHTIVQPKSPVVLLSTVFHSNLGDSFIWIGEEIILQKSGCAVLYRCPVQYCEVKIIETYLQGSNRTTICMHGGGNFGDLYLEEAGKKLEIANAFPDHKILLFPQSIYYQAMTQMYDDADKFAKHQNLHIMTRDARSLSILKKYFSHHIASYYAPDMAFMIGEIEPMCEPIYDVVFLKRSDVESVVSDSYRESIVELFQKESISFDILDWYDEANYTQTSPHFTPRPTDNTLPLYALEVANFLLSRGRVILTDRLHAAILSLLMDRPVVCLDNIYGKVGNVTAILERWPECSSLRRQYAKNASEILQYVKSYLRELPSTSNRPCYFHVRPILPSLYRRLKNTSLY